MEKARHQRKHFLIVENDQDDAFFIHRALSAVKSCLGARVCRNLSEAKAYLQGAGMYVDRAAFPYPQVVITKIKLGEGSGIDLFKWTQVQAFPFVPAFILTGSPTEKEIEGALKLGVFRVYSKPVKQEDLVILLNQIIEDLYLHEAQKKPPLLGEGST